MEPRVDNASWQQAVDEALEHAPSRATCTRTYAHARTLHLHAQHARARTRTHIHRLSKMAAASAVFSKRPTLTAETLIMHTIR